MALITEKGFVMTADSNRQCQKHGEYVSDEIEIWAGKTMRKGCPSCSAEREAEREEDQSRQDAYKAEQARIASEARHVGAGITQRFRHASFDSFKSDTKEQAKAKDAMIEIVRAIQQKDSPKNLILTGRPGTGKSHLCCAAINELWRTHRVERVDLPALIRTIRATWAKDSDESEDAVVSRYGRLDLLILEEVGTGTGSADEKARLFSVLNERYEWCLPTVIVSNLGIDGIIDELGERLVDRLRDNGALIPFDWESARGRK